MGDSTFFSVTVLEVARIMFEIYFAGLRLWEYILSAKGLYFMIPDADGHVSFVLVKDVLYR